MYFRQYSTNADTLKEWARQLNVVNKANYPLYPTVESTLSHWRSILNQNIGKKIKVYMSFADSIEWRDRIFEGTLEAVGREFLLISDRQNNKWYMLWSIYIDFLEFSDEVIF